MPSMFTTTKRIMLSALRTRPVYSKTTQRALLAVRFLRRHRTLERVCSGRCTLPVQYQYLYILYLSLNTLQVYILIFPRSLRPWLVLETFQLLLHLLNSH